MTAISLCWAKKNISSKERVERTARQHLWQRDNALVASAQMSTKEVLSHIVTQRQEP